MAEAAQLISSASDKIAPLLLDHDADDARSWPAMVATIRRWASKAA
ncbi:hypothetical protein [Mycobacterium avium]|nr:hypothetical protein [Mycobacterium avium]